MINERGLKVRYPHRTLATVDHIVPTLNRSRPLPDFMAETMLQHLERNTAQHGIKLFSLGDENQGIVHVIAPQLGATQPGMTIACGDSHTATHGAFGAVAFGIGTSEISCVLGTGCVLHKKPKVRLIRVNGVLPPGVTAKDVILHILHELGVSGGDGYAYEYGGSLIEGLNMDQRMTICNMSIEGNARYGYINPDETTIEYLRGRKYVPVDDFDSVADGWLQFASGPDAEYDDVVLINGSDIVPRFTWGTDPSQSVGVDEEIPFGLNRKIEDALSYMKLQGGAPIHGTPVEVAFIGSCTNGRETDLREAAAFIKEHRLRVKPGVKALVVPGSDSVRRTAIAEGLDRVFIDAGWEFREAGCSMCLAMNDDKLVGDQVCVSTSNRNFKGRQGSKTGRTILASPLSVVASAHHGFIADARSFYQHAA